MMTAMAAAEVHILEETEIDRVERWRTEALERGGYDQDSAAALAVRHDVDLHLAIELIEQGCSAEVALQILL
jgi:hypothetical protein